MAEGQPFGADQVWVVDLTYIRLASGFVYLAVILDWSRRVVGYASATCWSQVCFAALEAALEERRPVPPLVHHSDLAGRYRNAGLPKTHI